MALKRIGGMEVTCVSWKMSHVPLKVLFLFCEAHTHTHAQRERERERERGVKTGNPEFKETLRRDRRYFS